MRNILRFLTLLSAVVLAATDQAATVTTTADGGPGSLRQAIADAVPGDTISFSVNGVITLTSAELLVNKSLVIAGPGADKLAIQRSSAAGTPNFRIFHISSGIVSLSGLTLQGGDTDIGGGIDNETTFTLRDCILTGNSASQRGGAINNASTLTMSNCLLTANSVLGGTGVLFGGGVNNERFGTLKAFASAINGNFVSGGSGGGIYNDGTLALTNSLIQGNSATNGGGGGIFNEGTLSLGASTISSNSAANGSGVGQGGGIDNDLGTVTLDRCTVSSNLAALVTGGPGEGGGIANLLGSVTVENSTISGNAAAIGGAGGGIYNDAGSVTLNHSTVTTNSAPSGGAAPGQGGGLFNSTGLVEIKNTIVAGNFASLDVVNGDSGDFESGGFNLFGSTNGPITIGPNDQFNLPAAAIKLGPLQGNGGPTLTHALLCGSPAINAGDNTNAPPFDQRGPGFPRIVGSIIDIGSFEYSNSPPTISCPLSPITYNCASPTGAVETLSVDVTDADGDPLQVVWSVDGVIYQTTDVPPGGPPTSQRVDFTAIFGLGPHTVSVSVSDIPSGCETNCSATVNIVATPPSISCAPSKTNECSVGTLDFDSPTSSNICGTATITILGTVTNRSCGNTFVAKRTWVATDQYGSTASCSQTIALIDTTAPSITCPGNLTVSCANLVPAPDTNGVITSDSCGGPVAVSWQGDSIGSSNCAGQFVITRTYRAIDACKNSATCTQLITVQDTNPPSITCPTNLTVTCANQVPAPDTKSVTTSDTCGGAVSVSWQGDSISSSNCPGQFVITRSYRAADQCGNSATCTQTITVHDTTPPTITCPTNLTVSCANQTPPNTNSVTTSDNCGGVVTVTWDGDSISSSNCPGQFTIHRTYRATDQCGNSATCIQTITVQDSTPPDITCPTNLTVSCASQVPPPNTNTVTTSDNCGGPVIVTWEGDSLGSSNCPGQFVISRTYQAADQCGNRAICVQTIAVQDTNPPSITCPANLTVSCANQVPAPDTNSVTTSDNCGGIVTVSWHGDSVNASNCPGQFTISRTYRAADQCGNIASCIQSITVQDTNPPSITCPANLTVSCANQVPAPDTNSVRTSDDCGGTVTVSWQGDSVNASNCPGQFVITRTYRAADSCGNSATCIQTITVQDTNPPSITCPTNLTVSCANQVPAPNTNSVTTSDNCGGPVTVSWQGDSISSSNCPGQFVIARTYRAADSCGNAATCVQTITVQDTTPPSITCPTNLTVSCSGQVPAPNTNSVTTSDNCGGAVTVTWQGDSISASNCPGQFVISRTYQAADQCGNSATCTQTITVQDTTPPSITCPTNLTVGCASQVPAPNTNSVTTSDNCGGPVTVTWQGDSIGSSNCPGQFVLSRTYRATDQCGNSATCAQIISVQDTTPPSITAPSGGSLGCNPANPPTDASLALQVTVTDTCSAVTTNVTHVDVTNGCDLTRTFTVTASDACHNTATTMVTYTWTDGDTTPPDLTVPSGGSLGCNPTNVPTDASLASQITVRDNCSAVTTNVTHVDVTNGCSLTRTFTVTATDGCANTASKTVVYSWTADTTAPVITAPSGGNLGCNPANLPTDSSVASQVTVSDACGVVSTNVSHLDVTNGCTVTRTFTVSASDACNNATTKTVVYAWTPGDAAPPVLTVPNGGNLGCNPSTPPTDSSVASQVTASSACSAVISTNVTHVDATNGCLVTRTFTVTVADACNNSTSKTLAYTWTADTTPPTIVVPNGATLGCNPINLPTDASVASQVTVNDTCSGVTTNVTHVDSTNGCVVTRTFTVSASDACTNTASKAVVFTWTADTTPPALTVPGGGRLGCNPSNPPTDSSVASQVAVSDTCSAVTSTNVTHIDSTNGCVLTRTFTVTATDACANTASKTVAYDWTVDTTPPTLTVPSGGSLGCNPVNPPTDASVAALVTASDTCSAVSTNVTHADSTNGCVVTRTFTVTASDACTNTASKSVVYSWTADTTAPVITVPSGGNLGCNPTNLPTDSSVASQVTVSDTCSAVTTNVTHLDATNGCTVTRTFTVTASDACNNLTNKTVAYAWTPGDAAPPSLTVPNGGNLGCNPASLPSDSSVASQVTASSTCSAVTTTNVTHVDATNGCLVTRTFTVTVGDACNNTTSKTVAYTWTADTTPPTIVVPSGATLGCNPVSLPTDASVASQVTVNDTCSAVTTNVTHVDATNGCLVTRTFTVSASDACTNTASKTVAYTWTADTTPPVLTVPGGGRLGCNPSNPPTDSSVASQVAVSDTCSAITSTNVTHVDSTNGCVLTRTFTVTATDACANTASKTVTYDWTVDNTPPTLTVPSGGSLGCNPATLPSDSSVASQVTASSTCSAVTTTNVTHVDATNGCLVTRTFTVTAGDACNNTTSKTLAYNWTADTTSPALTVPSGGSLGCNPVNPPTDASVASQVTVSDTCSAVTTNVTHVDATNGCMLTRTFTVTASDACNNTSTKPVVYTWTAGDTTPPDLTVPSGGSLGCNPTNLPTDASVASQVTVSDNCSAVTTNVTHLDTTNGCSLTRTFTVTAADACTNTASKTVAYNWTSDTAPPTLTVPSGGNLGCNPANPPTDASVAAQASVNDTCSAVTTNVSHVDATNNCVLTRTFTVTAGDACNNTTAKAVIYTWTVDTTPPILMVPTGGSLGCNPLTLPTDASVGAEAEPRDSCSVVTTNVTHVDTTNGCVVTRTFTVTASDACANTTTKTVVYSWTADLIPPTITCSANKTNQIGGGSLTFDDPTASDNCGPVTVTILSTVTNLNNGSGFVATRTWLATDPCGNTNACSQTIATINPTPPTITCPAATTLSCVSSTGALATISVHVADSNGAPLIVVWTVDGAPLQTNNVPAGTPPTGTNVSFTAVFLPGLHQISVTVSDPNGLSATCSTTLNLLTGGAPTITCPPPMTLCAPSNGSVATISVTVSDPNGARMVVVWTANGVPVQTNVVPASHPPASVRVDLTGLFPVGANVITVSVSNSSGCIASCSTTTTVVGLGDLYPIALNVHTLDGKPVGSVLTNIYNGSKSGNFGWLTWAGSPSEPTLARSLTPPGNSRTYVNPFDRRDHVVSIGDWVQGKPGVTNSREVRKELDVLETIDIVVPVWDHATAKGNNSLYHIVAFARVRILDYHLPQQNRITARFLGLVDCN